jgi:hypothetical protein
MDIIEVTPAKQPYETLKEQLLSHFQMSEYERLDELFTMPDLGGRKLSTWWSPYWKCACLERRR